MEDVLKRTSLALLTAAVVVTYGYRVRVGEDALVTTICAGEGAGRRKHMAKQRREGAKTMAIIVSVLVIIVLFAALFALFHGAHTGG